MHLYVIIRKYRWNRLKCEAENTDAMEWEVANDAEMKDWLKQKWIKKREHGCEMECKIIEKERHGARINIISSDTRHTLVQTVWITNGILLCTYFINCMSRALLRVRVCVYILVAYISNSYIAFNVRPLRDPSSSMLACAAHTSIPLYSLYFHTWIHLITAPARLEHSCVCMYISTSFFALLLFRFRHSSFRISFFFFFASCAPFLCCAFSFISIFSRQLPHSHSICVQRSASILLAMHMRNDSVHRFDGGSYKLECVLVCVCAWWNWLSYVVYVYYFWRENVQKGTKRKTTENYKKATDSTIFTVINGHVK